MRASLVEWRQFLNNNFFESHFSENSLKDGVLALFEFKETDFAVETVPISFDASLSLLVTTGSFTLRITILEREKTVSKVADER